MGILCNILGHKKHYVFEAGRPCWSQKLVDGTVVRDWHKTVYIPWFCDRCFYEHGISIDASHHWPTSPAKETP